jgi:hypothetical protein
MARTGRAGGLAIALAVVAGLGLFAGGSLTREPAIRATGSGSAPRDPAPLRPGSIVPSANVGAGVFADSRHGFTLARIGASATYPAATADGGRTWRIDGAVLPVPASGDPGVVTEPGVAGPRTYFVAVGIGGLTVIEVTTDAGKRWWRTLLPGGPVFVGAFDGELTAIVTNSGSIRPGVAETFLAYRSKTGRRWTYADSLSAAAS